MLNFQNRITEIFSHKNLRNFAQILVIRCYYKWVLLNVYVDVNKLYIASMIQRKLLKCNLDDVLPEMLSDMQCYSMLLNYIKSCKQCMCKIHK